VLTEQLQKLAERQAQTPVAPATPTAPAPLEITGTAYIGSPDRPAARASIGVIDVQTGKRVRELKSDDSGEFTTGPLAGGDYALLAGVLEDSPNKSENYVRLQSAPIQVYPGVAVPPQSLNLAFPYGRLAIELSRPLPTFEVPVEGMPQQFESRLLVKVKTPRLRAEQWTDTEDREQEWPIFISQGARARTGSGVRSSRGSNLGAGLWNLTCPPNNGLWFFELLDTQDLNNDLRDTLFQGDEGKLPTAHCQVVAWLVMHEIGSPAAESTTEKTTGSPSGTIGKVDVRQMIRQHNLSHVSTFGPSNLREMSVPGVVSDEEKWLKHIWYDLSNLVPAEDRSPDRRQSAIGRQLESFDSDDVTLVPIELHALTTIRIEIPDDLESRIQLINDASQPEAAKAAWDAGYPFLRPAKITVVGTAPLPPAKE
jgi:hypothetical protein